MGKSYCNICNNRNNNTKFRMPNPNRTDLQNTFEKWLLFLNNPKFLNKPNIYIYNNVRVCSIHFQEEDFVTGFNRKMLNKLAVPTLPEKAMDWSNEKIVEFIELLQDEPVIWDPKKKSHKNRTALNDAWVRIKNVFSVPYSIEELKKKRNSLMTAYREHLRKIKETTTSGSSADDVYKPTWFAFELMNSFLGTVYEYQNTINTEPQGDLSMERPLSRDSDRSSLNENIQTDDTLPTCSKRRRSAQDLLLAKKRMDEAFLLIKERSRVNVKVTDETDIYGQLLAQKLKKLDEDDRLTLMNDIDNLTFKYIMNARTRTKNATKSKIQIQEESLVAAPKNYLPHRSSPTPKYN